VSLQRPDAAFFDFEQEKYSLEALRDMVLQEVNSPCSPYRSSNSGRRQAVEVDPPTSYRPHNEKDDDDDDGPHSQKRTQVRQSGSGAKHDSITGESSRKSSESAGKMSGGGEKGGGTKRPVTTRSASSSNITGVVKSASNQPQPNGDKNEMRKFISGQLGPHNNLHGRNSSEIPRGSVSSATPGGLQKSPRTPTHEKMEAIAMKDRKQKRLFEIQDKQKKQLQQVLHGRKDQVESRDEDTRSVHSGFSIMSGGSRRSEPRKSLDIIKSGGIIQSMRTEGNGAAGIFAKFLRKGDAQIQPSKPSLMFPSLRNSDRR